MANNSKLRAPSQTENELMEEKQEKTVDRVTLLKVPIDIISPEALPDRIEALLREGRTNQIVLLTLSGLLRARRNNDFRAWVLGASLVVPVSKGLIRGIRFLYGIRAPRWMPFDFVVHLLGALEPRNHTLYLLGARRKSLLTTERNLRQTFPGIHIVGRYAGGFRRSGEGDVVTGIRKASPALLLVGRGVPGHEMWIYRNLRRLGSGFKLWCDDLFDVFSEHKRRPSTAIWDHGLEGIARVFKNPFSLLRIFPWLYYNYLLLFYKIFKRRS